MARRKDKNRRKCKCRKSCNVCGDVKESKTEGGITFGVDQEVSGPQKAEVIAKMKEVEEYMKNTVHKDPKYSKVRAECKK